MRIFISNSYKVMILVHNELSNNKKILKEFLRYDFLHSF
jgi:hypothetical protein